MNARSFALTAVLMLIPASSLAQTTTPPTSPPPPVYLGGSTNQRLPSAASSQGLFESEINRRNLDERARRAVNNTSPARMDRAERVAELLNAGDCAGAHALAMQENDRRLARRIDQLCEADN